MEKNENKHSGISPRGARVFVAVFAVSFLCLNAPELLESVGKMSVKNDTDAYLHRVYSAALEPFVKASKALRLDIIRSKAQAFERDILE